MYGSYAAVVKNIDLLMKQLMLCFRIISNYLLCFPDVFWGTVRQGSRPSPVSWAATFFFVCVCVCVCLCLCLCGCSLLLGNPNFKDPYLLAQVVYVIAK